MQLPIEVSRVHVVPASASHHKPAETSTIEGADIKDAEQLIPPPVGFQGTSVLRDLEAIASPNPNLPKRTSHPPLQNATNSTPSTSIANRFIRRQHRKLLGKIPILTYSKHPDSPSGKYQVSLSPLAHSGFLTRLTSAVPMADEADLAWLRLPPPPQEPNVVMEPTPSQEPEVKMEPMAKEKPKPDKNPQVDTEPKHESNREGRPRVNVNSGADHNPRVFFETGAQNSSVALDIKLGGVGGRTTYQTQSSPNRGLRETRCFDGTAGEGLKRGKSRPGLPPPKGIRLFKGSLTKKKEPDKPQPQS